MTKITVFLVNLLTIASIVLSGCVSTEGSADVMIINMAHLETVDSTRSDCCP